MKIQRTITLDASSEHVWHILANRFHDVGEWATIINVSERLKTQTGGAGVADRVCDTPDGIFKEQVTSFDEQARTFSYVAYEGLPGFVRKGGNTWGVRAVGRGKTEVHMCMEFDLNPIADVLMGWMLKRQMGKAADGVLADLKVYAETGEVSESKRAALAKHAKKAA